MANLKICDKEVQRSIREFIGEARICALTRRDGGILGFAAMSTIFSCILALGESILGRRAKVDEAIEAVYKEMPGKASWLLTPEGPNPDDTIVVGKIKQLRDALVHQLSLPNDTILFPNRESARSGTGHAWGIIVPEFIDAVESAVPRIVEKHGNKKWDPGADEKTPSRGPAAALYSTDIRAEAPTSGSASRRV